MSATGVVQSVATATAGALVERDGNGDSRFKHVGGDQSLNSAGIFGGVYLATTSTPKTGNYSPAETDFFLPFNCTGGDLQCNLPAAASSSGLVLAVQKTDTSLNAVIIDGNASETVGLETTIFLTTQNEIALIQCDGSNWVVLWQGVPPGVAGGKGVAKVASFSAGGDGRVYLITTAGGTIVVTLPPAARWEGKVLTLKKVDGGAGSVSLTTNLAETVDGTNDPTGLLSGAGAQYDVLNLLGQGGNWHYLADRGPAT